MALLSLFDTRHNDNQRFVFPSLWEIVRWLDGIADVRRVMSVCTHAWAKNVFKIQIDCFNYLIGYFNTSTNNKAITTLLTPSKLL